MSSNGGFSKSSKAIIPNTLKKTIQHIKEIAKNHSEDDIYAMLKECSMDPNETTQRLLYLDTFHVVKSKRDKRKEAVKTNPEEDPWRKSGHQVRGTWRDRGNTYYSGGRRSNFNQKAQGVKERDKVFRRPTTPASKEPDIVPAEKALSIAKDGPAMKHNGDLGGAHDSEPNHSKKSVKDGSDILPLIRPNASAGDAPSPSDPALVTLDNSWTPIAVSAKKGEAFSSVVQREPSKPSNVAQPNILRESVVAEKSHVPCSDSVRPSSLQGGRPLSGAEAAVSETVKLKILDGQQVIIPDHIQVPDAVKNMLSFGSIDASFRVANVKNNKKDLHSARVMSPDKATDISSSCDKDAVSTLRNTEYTDNQWPQSHLPDEKYRTDIKVSSSATNNDRLKQDNLPAVGPPFPLAHTMPSYNIGFMPPMLGNTLLQSGGIENLAPFSNSLHGDLPVRSTESSTPPSSQSSGVGHAPITVSPQAIPLFSQPYPPNYIPYNQYFSPFYLPQTMLQYYGQTPFPPPLPNGNVLLPTPAAMKNSPSHLIIGANTENQAPATTSGNPSTSAGPMPTALKDKNMYSGQQSEGYGGWLPPVNFPINSFVTFPQGQQLINPQSSRSGFTVYRTLQPIPTAAPPGQPVTGEVE